jgi:uncharacterized membrane protein
VDQNINGPAIEMFHLIVEWAAIGIEALAVLLIVAAVLNMAIRKGTVRYIYQLGTPGAFTIYKQQLGKALLLGLELMVAADVIRTVTFAPTLANVGILGLLVLIRTFLSWAMSVELEGEWPWQASALRGGKRDQQEKS